MKTIEAYKCNYCNKVYQLKNSCVTHEKRCYKNPNTKSCASCLFLMHGNYGVQPGYFLSLLTCLRNHDVTKRLKTACNDFCFIKTQCDSKEMEQISSVYNPEPFIQPIIENRRKKLEEEANTDNHNGNLEQIFYTPF